MNSDAPFPPSTAPVSHDLCRQAFAGLPHLLGLSETDCQSLAPLLHAREFPAGSTLFYEDDDSDAAYFLMSGAIEVFKSNPEGKKLPLVVLRDNGLLGEIGLLSGLPRTATARAFGHISVLELGREAFDAAIQEGEPAMLRLGVAFARILADRLASTSEKMFELFQNEAAETILPQFTDLQTRLLTRWTG